TQRLRREPVLAVSAVQVATQHPESQSVRTRQRMKERLLLGRIALQSRHVISRHAQVTVLVEADFADAALSFLDQAAMAAGIALERQLRQLLGQLGRAFGGHLIQNFGERSSCSTQWHNRFNAEIPMRNYTLLMRETAVRLLLSAWRVHDRLQARLKR